MADQTFTLAELERRVAGMNLVERTKLYDRVYKLMYRRLIYRRADDNCRVPEIARDIAETLFHEKVPFEFIARAFAVMLRAHQHTYLVLTKRGERCATLLNDERFRDKVFHELIYSGEYYCAQCQDWYECAGPLDHCPNCGHECDLGAYEGKDPPCPQCGEEVEYEMTCQKCGADGGNGGLNCTECWSQEIESNWMKWPPPNVHLGVSVSTQADLDEQLPHLLKCLAAVRFVSVEPLLGPIELCNGLYYTGRERPTRNRRLDWVVVGGESGPNARDCGVNAITSVVDQCRAANVPVWVKQDFGRKPGQQGRIPDKYWVQELPR